MPRPARGFCFGGTAPPKSATYARAREGRPRYSPLGNGCIAQRYAQAREGRRLFCPLEKGGRNHAEPFFVPDMAMKPHKPVPGTGAADFACPPLASAGHRMARPDLRHGCELAHPWRVLPGAIGIRGGEARGFCLRKNLQWGPMARRPPICGPLRARARPFDAF
jgi:hypothetical protein